VRGGEEWCTPWALLLPSLSPSPSHHLLSAEPGLPVFPRCTEGTFSPSFPTAPSVQPYSRLPPHPGSPVITQQVFVPSAAHDFPSPSLSSISHLLPLWVRPLLVLFHVPVNSDAPSPTDPYLLRSRGVSRHFPGR
jgi:hypothetical protein